MGGYNFDLGDDEDLTLDAPLVDSVADATNVAALPMATAAPDKIAPTPTPAPASAPVAAPSPADQFNKDYLKYWMDRAKHGAESATFSKKEPVRVSTAPEWYKGGPPPGGNDWAKALIGMGAGMISGPAQVAMQNPLRPLGQKMQDAKQVALGQGLGALLGGLVGKKQTQYDNELNAAKGQAAMQHVTSAGESEGEKEAALAARMIGLYNQSRGTDSLIQNRDFQQSEVAKLHDPNAAEALAAKKLLIDKGLATAEQLQDATLATMQKQYPILNTIENEQARAAQFNARAENERGNIAARAKTQSELNAERQRNEDVQKQAQAYVGDDVEWKGGLPPDTTTQTKARTIYAAKNYGVHALDRMTEIQNELEKMGHGFSGTVDEWLGRLEGPEGIKAQKLVTEAEQLQNYLTIQARQVADMGVPQEWEQTLVKSLNPRAGSLVGFLKGNSSWETLKKSLIDYSNIGMAANGLVPKGQGRARPEYETTKVTAPPIAKVKGKEVVLEEDVPQVDDALPVAPVPPAPKVAAPAAAGPKLVTIRLGGDTRQVPADQAQRLKAKNPQIEILP